MGYPLKISNIAKQPHGYLDTLFRKVANVIYSLPRCLDRNEMTSTTLTFGIYVCLSAYSPYYDDSNCIVARRPKLFPVSNGQIKQLPREVHEISTISHTHKCLLDMKRQKCRFLSATNFISF